MRECVCTSAWLLRRRRRTAARLREGRLARARSVVVQTLQDALGQRLDVSVRLWVCVDQLQLLQAALLQQHAAVASGCNPEGDESISHIGKKNRLRIKAAAVPYVWMYVGFFFCVPTVLAADVLHGPSRPQLHAGGVEALQQRKEGIERPKERKEETCQILLARNAIFAKLHMQLLC